MYINHNGMAANVANTLTSHYSNLATSTQRLSSGLRVNSAADDAAGLAIRELMRADISALQQGVRNANDGISLIQTADGALGIIDEKLIRMKELAEQAATGTYDSTQRLMIESEYQAMASEITRIANATDFNGIKLLNGDLEGTHDGSKMKSEGALKVHFGTANDSAEDYYYIEIEEMTAQALGVGNASTWDDVSDRAVSDFKKALTDGINNDKNLTETDKGKLLAQVNAAGENLKSALTKAVEPEMAYDLWSASDKIDPGVPSTDDGFLAGGKNGISGNSTLLNDFLAAGATQRAAEAEVAAGTFNDTAAKIATAIADDVNAYIDDNFATGEKYDPANVLTEAQADKAFEEAIEAGRATALKNGFTAASFDEFKAAALKTYEDEKATGGTLDMTANPPKFPTTAGTDTSADFKTVIGMAVSATSEGMADAEAAQKAKLTAIQTNWDGLRETEKEKLRYAFGQAAMHNLANASQVEDQKADGTDNFLNYGIGAVENLGFGADLDGTTQIAGADKILEAALTSAHDKIKDMDFAGHTIETQEDAQNALNALNDAIVQKDKTRAHLGALQNRLENTVSNLTVQAENLQAAESRISDVDVATEMTNFVRNQILTQSAVAMLSQANSMPQMAMQLIG